MIAYEELVTALNNWRARNGLPTTPVDYGEPIPVASYDDAQSAPDEVYDLSDDSGLIMTEDVAQAQDVGAIESGVEISQTADEADYGDYAEAPHTGDYGDYDSGQTSDPMYDDMAPADTMDADDADAYLEPSDRGETLDADGDDVIEEQPAYDDVMAGADYDEPIPLDDAPYEEQDLGGETAVAREPGEDEPDELPDAPDADDDEPRYE